MSEKKVRLVLQLLHDNKITNDEAVILLTTPENPPPKPPHVISEENKA